MIETDERGHPAEVLDLDASTLLAVLADKEAQERQAGRGKLRLAHQWCVLHPATGDSDVAAWGDAGLPGTSGYDEVLGADGTPLVAAFAPEPFAAALGVSTMSGMQLLADALEPKPSFTPSCSPNGNESESARGMSRSIITTVSNGLARQRCMRSATRLI